MALHQTKKPNSNSSGVLCEVKSPKFAKLAELVQLINLMIRFKKLTVIVSLISNPIKVEALPTVELLLLYTAISK